MPSKEIELTAKCTETEMKKAQDILIGRGAILLNHKKRFMVRAFEDGADITYPIDLRVKWTNGEEKITFKKGAVGSHEREETEIMLQPGSVFETLKMFQGLGYKNGVAMLRDTMCYEMDDLEASFVRAGDTYYIEIEYTGASDDKKLIEAKIAQLFGQMGLSVLTLDEYRELIKYLDKHENIFFSISALPDVLAGDSKWGTIWKEANSNLF